MQPLRPLGWAGLQADVTLGRLSLAVATGPWGTPSQDAVPGSEGLLLGLHAQQRAHLEPLPTWCVSFCLCEMGGLVTGCAAL